MHREAWWEPSSSSPAAASVVLGTLTTLWVKSAQTRCLALGRVRGRSVSSASPQAESSKRQGQAELGALLEHRRMHVQIKGKRETGSGLHPASDAAFPWLPAAFWPLRWDPLRHRLSRDISQSPGQRTPFRKVTARSAVKLSLCQTSVYQCQLLASPPFQQGPHLKIHCLAATAPWHPGPCVPFPTAQPRLSHPVRPTSRACSEALAGGSDPEVYPGLPQPGYAHPDHLSGEGGWEEQCAWTVLRRRAQRGDCC